MRYLPRHSLLIAAILVAAPALAGGVGFNFENSQSDLAVEIDWDNYWTDTEDFDVTRSGFGLLVDSNPLGQGVFAYRLTLDLESIVAEHELGEDFEGYGMSFRNTFAFGAARTPRFRFWIGPALRFYYDLLEDESGEWDAEMYTISLGVGPELGFNIGLGSRAAVTLALGYNYSATYMDYSDVGDSGTGSGDETLAYFQIGMLFGSLTDG